MATFDMTLDNFEETIKNNDIVLIDFWADWCEPCKEFSPIFDKVSESHNDVAFAKVDAQNQQELAGQFGIRSIPTVAVFREGILIFMQPGALPESALEELIGKVRELDMDEVRQQIAQMEEEQAQEPEQGQEQAQG